MKIKQNDLFCFSFKLLALIKILATESFTRWLVRGISAGARIVLALELTRAVGS